MTIQNFSELAISPLRKDCLKIVEAGFAAIKTKKVIEEQLRLDNNVLKVQGQEFNLKDYKKIICVGFGKVALEAVTAIQELLGDNINCGFVIDLKQGSLGNIVCRVGEHPKPTVVNVEATKELVAMLETSEEKDLVICVVGGGGSSLLCSPLSNSCENQNLITNKLFKDGATIQEINTVRKHISSVKGGNLAKICYPATVISLIFSDVPGNDISVVASGPTVKDLTTIHDARAIMEKYGIFNLTGLSEYPLEETPKEDKYFNKVHNFTMVSGHTALAGCQAEAEKLGYKVEIFSQQFQGEARLLGPQIMQTALGNKSCLLGCGESTVKILGTGKGGRNQELVLASLPYLKPGQILASVASDGHDNSESAGAIADNATLLTAQKLALKAEDYLNNNDSFNFFEKTSGQLLTGLTDTNVSDFFVRLKE